MSNLQKVVPMIHVPDVRAAVNWYQGIGFKVDNTYSDDGGGLSFAILSFGTSQVMFNQGGRSSTEHRREVDLYLYIENVDALYERLKDRVEVVERPHDTFYGMRELIIRDLNRFWITFGQPSVFEVLMSGVREGDSELVRSALESGGLKQEALTAALAVSVENAEIEEMLKQAGALVAPEVDLETLKSYVGKYKGEQGMEVSITLKDGKLFALPPNHEALTLVAIEKSTFRPVAFDGVAITFNVENGRAVGFVFQQGPQQMQLRRVEET